MVTRIPDPKEIRKSSKSFLKDIEWGSLLTFEDLLDNLLLFILGVIILLAFHFLGKWISDTIDARVIAKEKQKLQGKLQETESGVEEGDEESRDVFHRYKYRSRTSLASFAGQLIYFVIMILGFSIVLGVIGIQVATIITIVSTVGISVGLAIQGTLSDIASGILLALFQTYQVGDIIKIGDREGRVVDFRMINTLLQDHPSMTLVTIPNRVIQDSIVVNYSRSNYHMYVFDIRLSNHLNSDFPRIYDVLYKDIIDPVKYPEIYRNAESECSVGVHSMSEPSTIVRVKVPLRPSPDLDKRRTQIQSRLRATLKENDIVLVEFR